MVEFLFKTHALLLYAILFNFITSPILAKEVLIEKDLVALYEDWKDLYQKTCNKSINDLVPSGTSKIIIQNTKEGTLGICFHGLGSFEIHVTPQVVLNPRWEGQLRTVLFHEFAHCFFNIRHSNSEDNYMYPYIMEITKDKLYEQVLHDMQQRCNYQNF